MLEADSTFQQLALDTRRASFDTPILRQAQDRLLGMTSILFY